MFKAGQVVRCVITTDFNPQGNLISGQLYRIIKFDPIVNDCKGRVRVENLSGKYIENKYYDGYWCADKFAWL